MDESELVKRAQKDPESFGLLFDQYYDQVFGYVLKRTAHLQATQDITAEVFFKAYKKLWQFRWQGKPFVAWLYRIATNETSRYFQNNKRAPIPIDYMEQLEHYFVTLPSPEAELIAKQKAFADRKDLERLYYTIQLLPIKYQEVLALRYFENKSIVEVSQILGKKEGTVKSLLSRGVKLLEQRLQPLLESEVTLVESINHPSHEQTRN